MIFPYLDEEPIVPLEVRGIDGNWYEFHAYLDSGAGYSVFHADHAEVLGIDIYQGKEINLTVGDGSRIPTFIHKLTVRFTGKKFTAFISFSPSLGIGTNILGMKSFFDRFKICFNHKKQQVEVNPF